MKVLEFNRVSIAGCANGKTRPEEKKSKVKKEQRTGKEVARALIVKDRP
jgi:hypothetical protein